MTGDPVQRILTALREHGHEPKRSGAGWRCRCPAHDDSTPSLDIHAGDDGRALVCCQAGCTVDAVCGAVGMRVADLFASDPTRSNGHAPRTRQSITLTRSPQKQLRNVGFGDGDAKTYPTASAAVAALERRNGPKSAQWVYHNAAGEPVGVVVRWNTPTGKDIRPVSKTPAGWIIAGMPTPRPLYALPDLLATPAARVFIVEGEKAADAAHAVGLTATTSAHGAKSAKGSDWSALSGRDVVILPDHDEAGERYANDAARLVAATGAKSVRVVRLAELWAGMPEGGDIVDFIEHRGGDAGAIRAEIDALVDQTKPEAATTPEAPVVPAFAPFPVHVLPEPIRSFVIEGATAIGCDASYIALPLLAALASAIGNTHRIQLKRGWTEPSILWAVIVGESGTLKTPAFKLAMKAIRKAQADAFKEHAAEQADWEMRHLRYEAELTGWKRQAAKGHGDAGDPPEEPAPPIARRHIVSDTTTEALAPILLGNPRGVLLARDELAGWLGSFDRYAKAGKAGADSAHWLSIHNGEAMTVDRKTGTPPTIHVPSASVSITGGIQPGTLARALGQEHQESGMAARLLFAMPPRREKRWTDADASADTEEAVAAVFDRLFGLTPETDDAGDEQPRLLALTKHGHDEFVRFYNEHARQQAALSGNLSAAWSKLEGYAARLALVLHLTRWAARDASLDDPARVDEASVAAGVTLSRWFGDEARRVYAILGESDEGRESRRLVEWIERKGGSVTARDLTRGPREYRGDPEKAAQALGELVAAGVGRWELDNHAGGRGCPADRFRLLSRPGDTGDGDANSESAEDCGISVTVATVATPTHEAQEAEA